MQRIELTNKTILVTGAAGFIGSNLVLKLLESVSPVKIVGIDNLNDNYDVSSKDWRLVPYFTDDKVDNPVSLYAATKKSNEVMAHAY